MIPACSTGVHVRLNVPAARVAPDNRFMPPQYSGAWPLDLQKALPCITAAILAGRLIFMPSR